MNYAIQHDYDQANRGRPIKFSVKSINNILKCCALVVSIVTNVVPVHAFEIKTEASPKIKSDDGSVELDEARSALITPASPKIESDDGSAELEEATGVLIPPDPLTIRSDDGNFEMALGGRAHLDFNSFNDDKSDPAYPAFGSQIPGDKPQNSFDFRRGWLDVSGKYYDLTFIVQNNFSSGASPESLLRVWASIGLGPGRLTVGQFKAHRSMEELTSSNEITLMERPSNSSSGIFKGRQWLLGVGYQGLFADQLGYAVNVMSLTRIGMPIAGSSYGGRVYWLAHPREDDTLHLGLSYSIDTSTAGSLATKVVDVYGGSRGFIQSYGVAGAAAGPSGNRSESTLSLEAAYALGPVNLQAEYAAVKLDNTHLLEGVQKDSHVQAYYVQASWFVTGERTIYRKELGVFSKPQPLRKWGAIEIAARYDAMENKDQSLAENPCGTGTTKCQTQVVTLGINWYVRKGLRFMLNYYLTQNAIGNTGAGTPNRTDSPSVVSFRTQLNF